MSADPWLDLEQLGQAMHAWRGRNFPGRDESRDALQLCEESGEVARAVGKEADGIRAGTRGSTAEELGDVVLAAAALAARKGINLAQVTRERRDRALKLDFRRWPETGLAPAEAPAEPGPPDELAYTVECPTCGASPRRWCHTTSPQVMALLPTPHAERVQRLAMNMAVTVQLLAEGRIQASGQPATVDPPPPGQTAAAGEVGGEGRTSPPTENDLQQTPAAIRLLLNDALGETYRLRAQVEELQGACNEEMGRRRRAEASNEKLRRALEDQEEVARLAARGAATRYEMAATELNAIRDALVYPDGAGVSYGLEGSLAAEVANVIDAWRSAAKAPPPDPEPEGSPAPIGDHGR